MTEWVSQQETFCLLPVCQVKSTIGRLLLFNVTIRNQRGHCESFCSNGGRNLGTQSQSQVRYPLSYQFTVATYSDEKTLDFLPGSTATQKRNEEDKRSTSYQDVCSIRDEFAIRRRVRDILQNIEEDSGIDSYPDTNT